MTLADSLVKIWREYHRRTSVLRRKALDSIRYANEKGYTARFAKEVLEELEKIHNLEQDLLSKQVEEDLEEAKQTTLESLGVNAKIR